MAKVQRLGRNSSAALVSLAAQAVSDEIPLPQGVILRSDDEMVIWRQFTRVRARDDWRDFDLLLVAKAVRIEADIRKHQMTLDGMGPMLENNRGTPVANPLVSVIDSLQRQQLAIIRSLSLAQTATDPRTKNANGAALQRFRKENEQLDELIAQ